MKKSLSMLIRLYGLTGPGFIRHGAVALGAGLAPVIFNLVLANALKNVFAAADALKSQDLHAAIAIFTVSIAGFFLFNCTMWGFFCASVARRTGHVRKALFSHLCGLPLPELEHSHSAAALTLFLSDAPAVENAYGYLLRYTIAAVLSGLTAAVAMFIKSPAMGLLILGTGFLQLACNLLVTKPLQRLSHGIAAQIEQTGAAMGDILDGSVTIRLYGMERHMLELYRGKSLKLLALNRRLSLLEGIIKGGNTLAAMISYLLTLAIGIGLVSQGSLSLPDLLFLTQIRGLVMVLVFSIGDFAQMAQPALAGAERIFTFLDKPVEKKQYDGTAQSAGCQYGLQI